VYFLSSSALFPPRSNVNSLNYGLGRHIWFLTDEQRIGALKYDFLSQPLGKYFLARPKTVPHD
jgi:hypothetical protein